MPFSPTTRLDWIDATKGIAIVLVVLGHCWIGLHGSALITNDPLYEAVRKSIYLFHMPLFFVVSGLMTYKLTTTPFGRFLTSRIMLLIYPMILWTYLMNVGKLGMGGLANEPVTWDSFNWNPLPPQWQFWFLWALFTLHIVTRLIAGVAHRARRHLTVWHWVAVLGMAILVDTFGGTFGGIDPYIRHAMLFAPFFFLGVVLSYAPPLPIISPVWPIAGFVTAQAVYHTLSPPLPIVMLLASIAALSVMLICRWLTAQAKLTSVMAPLISLGVSSMAIYLAHTFFSAPIRAILVKLDIASLPLHVVLGTALGILGPLILLWISKSVGGRRALGF